MDELATFASFDERPADAYLHAWREHISSTGYPETFMNVSTSRPVDADGLVLLSEVLRVPTARRDGGELVPCPICSPHSPKFRNGRMAWFPAESAVRFIGHECAATHFGETYTAADQRFQREALIRRYIGRWDELQKVRIEVERYHTAVARVAESLQECRRVLDEQGNGFIDLLRQPLERENGTISEMIATGEVDSRGQQIATRQALAVVSGVSFFDRHFAPAKDTVKIRKAIDDLKNDLPGWSERNPDHDLEKEILARGKEVDAIPKRIIAMAEVIAAAQPFLNRKNFAALGQYSQKLGFRSIEMKFDGRQLSLRAESFRGGHYARPFVRPAIDAIEPPPQWLISLKEGS